MNDHFPLDVGIAVTVNILPSLCIEQAGWEYKIGGFHYLQRSAFYLNGNEGLHVLITDVTLKWPNKELGLVQYVLQVRNG